MQKIVKDKKYWQAVAMLVGYIVGVGMFGLPFISARSGVLIFFVYMFALGGLQYLVQLVYASIVCANKDYHQLPGYAGIYFGKFFKKIVFIAVMVANFSALLAYIIITGIFLSELLSPFFSASPFVYASLAFGFEVLIVYFGLNIIARFELFLSAMLLLIVFAMAFRGSSVIAVENYFPLFDWKYLFLPYGAALFALDGSGIIPSVAKMMNRETEKLKSVIRTGLLFSVLITVVFVLTILGISGPDTTADALSGVRPLIGNSIMVLALVFGFISIATSTLGVLEAEKDSLWRDFGINKKLSWFITAAVPYSLYAFGIRDLIGVINFAGAVAGGFCSISLLLIFLKIKKKIKKINFFKNPLPNWLIFLVILVLVCGVAYNLI